MGKNSGGTTLIRVTREEFFSNKGPAKGHSTCKGPEVGNSLHI